MPVNGTMQTEKLFEFSDPRHSAEDENLKVTIVETIDAHYSLYVWPCAVVLAQYLWCNRSKLLTGKHVLELGAGTALPSIVAAMCGKPASVTITDDESCLQWVLLISHVCCYVSKVFMWQGTLYVMCIVFNWFQYHAKLHDPNLSLNVQWSSCFRTLQQL